MEQNIQGAICILKTMEMKPNFSELGRKYGMDRHTIAKYWKQGGIKKVKERFKTSWLDK